jgi:hypothetical protein
VGWEKHFFIINFNESTYNVETGHCSMNPDPGLLFNVLRLLCFVSLLAQGWLKGWDNRNMKLGRVSLLSFFLFQMGPLALLL